MEAPLVFLSIFPDFKFGWCAANMAGMKKTPIPRLFATCALALLMTGCMTSPLAVAPPVTAAQ
ncbi:MAG TPA: hypothetical protein VFE47_15075, partial [Tepidisphaeraceae bacterium]|nr:hypothetical protein [Tepidisphaeraceae bacterium]